MKNYITAAGKQIIIREAQVQDAEAILAFAKSLFASTDQVLTVPDEFKVTPEQERVFIKDHLERNNAVLLVAMDEDKVVSLLNFSCHAKKKMSHSGELGVSVLPAYQKMGIGREMMQALLQWAETAEQVEKIYLNVMHTNPHAIRLYRQVGFEIESRQIKAIKQPDGTYADLVCMSWFK